MGNKKEQKTKGKKKTSRT